MLKTIIAAFRTRLENHRRYSAIIAEIEQMNSRDLVDMGADRTELLQGAWHQIYG